MSSPRKTTPTDKLSFEDAMDRLEQIIDAIESGEVGLEESLKQFEDGSGLIKHCRGILDRAEKRIAELTFDADGEPMVEEGDTDAEDA